MGHNFEFCPQLLVSQMPRNTSGPANLLECKTKIEFFSLKSWSFKISSLIKF